jgi:hypothetical protein
MILFVLSFFIYSLFSQVPDYEFIIEPTALMNSYYDYMPGGYNNIPIHIQPEVSYPNGHPAGGVYIVFHAQVTSISERYVYYSYIDSLGNVISTDLISTNNVRQGYVGMDIDPITCNPICSWHAVVEPDNSFDCLLSTDVYYILGSIGNWTDEFVIIDNPEVGLPLTGFIDDEFIWPAVFISNSSPLGGDYRRIYVSANNYSQSHGGTGMPCENVLFGYADFLSSDLNDLSTLDWTHHTIEQMDVWSAGNSYLRPFKACAVHENIVVYAGYIVDYDNSVSYIFALVNENYGEGPFEYYSQTLMNIDIPHFSKNMNITFRDGNSKISFVGVRYAGTNQFHPRLISFDLNTHEFSFLDLYSASLPFIYYEDFFYYNNFKIVQTGNRLIAVWQDCLKALYASQGIPGYEEWLDVVEIAICISADCGETWSEPIFLNSNETPELVDLIPSYIYPGDVIEDLGNNHGKLHLFFFSDNSYGCYMNGHGQDFGGTLMYTSLDIDFGSISYLDNITVSQQSISMQNYPNPFNPSTTIAYNMIEAGKVSIEVFNMKGQKVKTLVHETLPAGEHSVVWNGRNSNGKRVGSGIYFYKLNVNGKSEAVKKCLLLK